MANGLNLHPARMIKVNCLLALLICLLGSTQASPQNVKVVLLGQSSSEQARGFQIILKNKVLVDLMHQYPCADPLTDDDVRTLLSFERERQLLGAGDEGLLAELVGALGARYLLSFNVIQVGDTFTMTAVGIDQKRGRAFSRQAATARSDEEGTDVANSLAEQFLSEVLDALPACLLNDWSGTITLSRVLEAQSRTTEEGFGVAGTTTTESTSKSTTEASLDVRGTKKPSKAVVTWKEEGLKNAVTQQTMTCGGPTPFEPGKTVTRNVTEVETTTGNAEGTVDVLVSVSLSGGEYTISFTVPEIDGGTATRDWTWKDSGGCGDPLDKHENTPFQWTAPELRERVTGKIDPAKPDVLAGSQTVNEGPAALPSMKQTTTITWNLKFNRVPPVDRNE